MYFLFLWIIMFFCYVFKSVGWSVVFFCMRNVTNTPTPTPTPQKKDVLKVSDLETNG